MLTLVAVSVGVYFYSAHLLKEPPSVAAQIGQLKIEVNRLSALLDGKTEKSVRTNAIVPVGLTMEEEEEFLQNTLEDFRKKQIALETKLTELALFGVTYNPNGKPVESYGRDSPYFVSLETQRLSLIELAKLLIAPLLLSLFAWISSFWLKRYMRLKSLLMFLSTLESDAQLNETLLHEARLMALMEPGS